MTVFIRGRQWDVLLGGDLGWSAAREFALTRGLEQMRLCMQRIAWGLFKRQGVCFVTVSVMSYGFDQEMLIRPVDLVLP